MAKDSLIDVIESLLEADMTKKDMVKNPQEESDDEMEEATQGEKLEKAPSKDEVSDKHNDKEGDGKGHDTGKDPDHEKINKAPAVNEADEGEDKKSDDEDEDEDGGTDVNINVDADGDDDEEEEMEEGKLPPALQKAIDAKKGKSDDKSDDEEEHKEAKHETEEELTAKQKKLDKDGDGDIGADDLKKVRAGEEAGEEEMEEEAVPGSDDKTSKPKANTSADDQGVLGKDGAAIDGGGDKDVGKLKEEEEHDEEEEMEEGKSVSLAGPKGKKIKATRDSKGKFKTEEADHEEEADHDEEEMEENKGVAGDTKDTGVLDAGGDKDEGKIKEEEEHDEEEEIEEDFKVKATVIFEAAVGEKVSMIREELQTEYEDKLAEETTQMNEKISEYVDYAVKEWVAENALEIKYSLRTEIAENFIRGLKGLFEDSYIDIPEEDVSVVDELTESVESYKEQLEEASDELTAVKQQVLEMQRSKIVEELSTGLTQTQTLRLEKLSEGLEAVDVEEFRHKVEELKEGYFDDMASNEPFLNSLTEEVLSGTEIIEEDDQGVVSQYAKFLSKTVLK